MIQQLLTIGIHEGKFTHYNTVVGFAFGMGLPWVLVPPVVNEGVVTPGVELGAVEVGAKCIKRTKS